MLDSAYKAADDALATEIVGLDVSDHTPFAEFFLVATVDNPRHMRATISAVSTGIKQSHDVLPNFVEGDGDSEWAILDYGNLVVHLFTEESREYYALEKLWGDAPRVQFVNQPGGQV